MIKTFKFEKTKINGLIKISPFISSDNRGQFIKDYSQETFEVNGIKHNLAEVFYTRSSKGVVRGLHFQREKQQAKLVRCICGHIYDVVVDLRKNSSTFKQWVGFDLNEKNNDEILVPEGCAHGFLVIEDAIVSYKCNEKFHSEYDDGILWNDPNINISWPTDQVGGINSIILSDKDKQLQTFNEFIKTYGSL